MERTINGTNTPYRIKRSKRTIYAHIRASHKGIEVTIPEKTPLAYAEAFAEKKRLWIIKKHGELIKLKESALLYISKDQINQNPAELKRQLKIQAKDIIIHYHLLLGRPNQLRIKEQSSRWGSCSSKGCINLNWKLIFAPTHVIEYVVVHELCHMTHMNHSQHFWRLVQEVLPTYEEPKNWLKKNGAMLMSID